MSEINQNRVSAQNYDYGPVVTPFQAANQQWDRPLGALVSKTAVWRWICVINVVLGLLLSLYLLMLVNAPQHRVWAVAMTPSGFVVNAGLLTQTVAPPYSKDKTHVRH
jgi:type IV secretory pathway TrbF-like protein